MAITAVANNYGLTGISGQFDGVATRQFVDQVQSGSLLVAITNQVDGSGSNTVTITDSKGDAWTSMAASGYSASNNQRVAIHYCKNTTADSGSARTITATATANKVSLAIFEYRGADTAAPFVTSSNSSGNGTAINPGALTTSTGAVFLSAGTTSDATQPTAGTGYTVRVDGYSGVAWLYELTVQDRIETAAQTSLSTAFAGTNAFWAGVAAAFKASSGASVAPIVAYYQSLRANE